MKLEAHKTLWTIGHSTHSFDEFIALLQSFNIEQLVDIRRFPGSRKFPQFNKANLEQLIPAHKMTYIYLETLGGRRKANPNSKNTTWHNASFRAYADYMETLQFKEGLDTLEKLAVQKRSAIMCSEAVWWRCHRSMVSDALKAKGWKVMHIMGIDNAQEHPFTQPAKIIDGTLSYKE